MPRIHINGQEVVVVEEQKTVLEAALKAGIYIPHLCFYPGLGTTRTIQPNQLIHRGDLEIRNDSESEHTGCNLCMIQVEGKDGCHQSCAMPVEDGMVVYTETDTVKEERKRSLANLLKTHPHACIQCEMAEGCDQLICSMDIPEEARCCWKFGKCELQEIAEYIGLEDISACIPPRDSAIIEDNPLFVVDYSLCIGCLRCVLACRTLAEREALGFVRKEGRCLVGSSANSLKKSGCKFCLACVEVCPSGALRDKDASKAKSKIRLSVPSSILPPLKDETIPLDKANVVETPDSEGVYQLYDRDKNVIQITGVQNLRDALTGEMKNVIDAAYFSYEEDLMYTARERQFLQHYMRKYGDFPPGNREIDELF